MCWREGSFQSDEVAVGFALDERRVSLLRRLVSLACTVTRVTGNASPQASAARPLLLSRVCTVSARVRSVAEAPFVRWGWRGNVNKRAGHVQGTFLAVSNEQTPAGDDLGSLSREGRTTRSTVSKEGVS